MTSRTKRTLIFTVILWLVCCVAAVSAQKIIVENAPVETIQMPDAESAAAPNEAEKTAAPTFETTERFVFDADSQIETQTADFRSDTVRVTYGTLAPSRAEIKAREGEGVPSDARENGKVAPLFPDDTQTDTPKDERFNWRAAIGQSLMFLAIQHGYAMTQPKTREALKHGAFWRDYAQSVKNLRGWDDGGRFFTNYLAHPMQGSFTGFIYVQNDPKARRTQFGATKDYWTTRMKALLWTTAWSTQFEIGPISQASIGNVGLKGKQTWEDIIVTPTVGTAWLVGEDAVDRFVTQRIERRTNNFYIKIFARMILSPTRNFSNLFRFKPPWHRDR